MERYMRRALELATRGTGRVNPNPLVGAVVVKNGEIVAEAYHEHYGGPHAEAHALKQAGPQARGAKLYVNWEPCIAYPGKKTRPCVDEIRRSGIRKVVVATRDPTPEVNGRGIAQLREGGIEVVEGVLEQEAQRLNEIRAKYATTGMPFVLLKMAMSADGKIATRTGDARWISSHESLELAHGLRNRYAAVLVGIGTALKDDPQLTVRRVQGRDPLRVVLDSQGKIPLNAKLLHRESEAPTAIATCGMSRAKEEELAKLETPTSIEIWRLPSASEGRIELPALVNELAFRSVDSVLLEGGAAVAAAFLNAKLLDKVLFTIAPKLLGGREAPSPIGGAGLDRVEDAFRLRDVSVRQSGPDMVYEGYVEYDKSSPTS